MVKIFIDPGHGGHDPGAIGANSNEKDNVLKVAKRIKTLLESAGHTVKMSRETDVYLTLSARSNMANIWKADYFVSLHDNSAIAKSATGFETFAHNGTVQSKTLAFQNAIHNAIAKDIGLRDRGKKRANFAVLRETRMPATLIEYGFISNPTDERILIYEVEKLARLTAKGIIDFVGGKLPVDNLDKGELTVSQYNELKKEIEQLKQQLNNNREVSLGFEKDWTWAKNKGLLDGSNPAKYVTREQLSAILHRFSKDNNLNSTTKKELKELFALLYEDKEFLEDHSEKISQMSDSDILNKFASFLNRFYKKFREEK